MSVDCREPGEILSLSRVDDVLWHGLQLLHRAYLYARSAHVDLWDFAVEIEDLRRAGLTNSELRWFLVNRLIEAAREVTSPDNPQRAFCKAETWELAARTCFVLAPTGVQLVQQCLAEGRYCLLQRDILARALQGACRAEPTQLISVAEEASRAAASQPQWDAQRKELRLGEIVVKRFRGPAVNQETVLTVFEEEDWPPRIDDPLPVVAEQDPKRRLHDTIKCLNRNQRACLMRFKGDGTGEGVLWQRASDD